MRRTRSHLLSTLLGGICLGLSPAAAHAAEEKATPLSPDWTTPAAWVRSAGLSFHLLPVRNGGFDPDLLVAGEASLSLPFGERIATHIRFPFLAHPDVAGSPAVGLAWAVHRRRSASPVTLLLSLRAFLPVAPEAGDGGRAAGYLRRLRPWDAALWYPGLTVSPGLDLVFSTARYGVRFATAALLFATGVSAGEVAIAYLLGGEVALGWGVELTAEVAGRIHTGAGDVTDVGVATGFRYRGRRFAPAVRARIPLGTARDRGPVVIEVSGELRF